MTSLESGYDDSRFTVHVDTDLRCAICLNVLRDPVQCRSNEHHFCRDCVEKHLETYRNCPSCMEELSIDGLRKPSRYLVKSLAELQIICDYQSRGCQEVVGLACLEAHLANCQYAPLPCTNDGCELVLDRRDKDHHEIRLCMFREPVCTDCRKTKEDIADLKQSQKQMTQVLFQMVTRNTSLSSCIDSIPIAALPKFRIDIIVAGGRMEKGRFNSIVAERFSWLTKTWSRIQPMREYRSGASTVVYENKLLISGGKSSEAHNTSSIEMLEMDQTAGKWCSFPGKLPVKVTTHNTVVYKDRMYLIGGCTTEGEVLKQIYKLLLIPPYTSQFVCDMPHPLCFHGAECFGKEVFIIGGCTQPDYRQSTDVVLKFDIVSKECTPVQMLPYPVAGAAIVSCNNKIIIIGGAYGKASNNVLSYDIESYECKVLPSMKYCRRGAAAVVSGDVIVVMGGTNEDSFYLDVVECFNLETQRWTSLPSMIQPRAYATAVIEKCNYG